MLAKNYHINQSSLKKFINGIYTSYILGDSLLFIHLILWLNLLKLVFKVKFICSEEVFLITIVSLLTIIKEHVLIQSQAALLGKQFPWPCLVLDHLDGFLLVLQGQLGVVLSHESHGLLALGLFEQ